MRQETRWLCDPRNMTGAFARSFLARWLMLSIALASCSATDLEHRIDALLEASANKGAGHSMGIAGIHVVDAATGQVLYSKNDDLLLLPASNFKLLTTALALDRLGADYRFTTRLIHEASGDLVLVGAGDPSFSGRPFPYVKNGADGAPMQWIEEFAAQAVAHGITQVGGDIVGDDRVYRWEPFPSSWTADDMRRTFGAPVSALSFNDNVVSIAIQPGRSAGNPAEITVSPPFEYMTFDDRVVTAARGSESGIRLERTLGSRQWTLLGSISAGHAAMTESVPVDDPALFAASALYDALTRRGVAIRGGPLARHRLAGEPYAEPSGEEIAKRVSPPLTELLQVMDKLSVNLHAELFLREVGRAKRGEGTTQAGLAELATFLKDMGASSNDWRAEDGSGLSRNDMVTPRLLTQVLVRQFQKFGDTFVSLLPQGGEDGTLDRRLCCMSGGRGVNAKTGTLARAIALSGYALGGPNGSLAFSILVNDFAAPPGAVREWIDKIAAALLE